ncbi:helix-turn-helix domain-containing protein [Streptomyces sp. NPDC054883]
MPVAVARPIVLTNAERERLKKAAYGHKTEHQARVRAHIVLHAARGRSNARVARETGQHLDTVRTWRNRFADGGLPALADRRRSGRPARFTPVQVAETKALACQLPAETGTPLSRWSCPELAAELTARGIADTVSASTVRRWLRQDALKPWQYRSWIFIRGPGFPRQGPAGPGPVRPHLPGRTPWPGRVRDLQRLHEYGRGGALAYLAAYDVHWAAVFGRCEATTGIVPFMILVEQVMTHKPYASAKRVFWIVDNGSSHRGKRAVDRLAVRFSNAVLVHTPVHASWLNQVEIFFSIVQRKVVPPNDFTDPPRSGTGSEHSKTATTPRHSRSSGGSPHPTICWPGSTDTHSPTDRSRPLSTATVFGLTGWQLRVGCGRVVCSG